MKLSRTHLYSNWIQVYEMPDGPQKQACMKNIKAMTKGNLHWLVRRLIGGIPSDSDEDIERWVKEGVMEPINNLDSFYRSRRDKRRNENIKRKN